jgi:acyl carrier protein
MNPQTENQSRIIEFLKEIIELKGIEVPNIGPETALDQIGLESLDFAEVVIRMEEITGKDPFATGTEHEIKILSDLAVLYD